MNKPDPLILAVAATTALVFLVFMLLLFSAVRLWIQALLTHTPVSILEIIGMRLRKTPPQLIVHATIALRQRGVAATARGVESCYLAFGRDRVATATQLADLYVEKVGELGGKP
jgi:uncharacterized protein YqfA (UPF0365 family)